MSAWSKKTSPLCGRIDHYIKPVVKGWAVDKCSLDESVLIDVFVADTQVDEITAGLFRWDLERHQTGWGRHGFIFQIPPEYLDGGNYYFSFRFSKTGRELENSPIQVSAVIDDRFFPFTTTDLTNNRVLVLSPHPDDESLACGGTLILHCRNSDFVKVLFLTDGSRATVDSSDIRDEYIRLREQEAVAACKILGVLDYEFWRLPDRGLGADNQELQRRLSHLLNSYRPSLIYAPSPFEFHSDHRATAELLWLALRKTELETKLAFYENNRPVNVNTLVDITSVIDQKMRACRSYKTQLKNFPYADCILGLNRYRALTVSPFCEYAEGYVVLDSHDVLNHPPHVFVLKQYLTERGYEAAQAVVSIIIRTRNRLPLLRYAISSVLTQTYSNIEIVVVNDGDHDVSEVIAEFGSHLTIRHVRLDGHKGRSAAANAGVEVSEGKYINFLDDDDILYSDHVEKLVTFLENSGRQMAYSDCELGHYKWDGKDFSLTGKRSTFSEVDFDKERLFLANYIPSMSMMFTRQLWDRVGSFDESFDYLEDWDFLIRASNETDFERLPGVTAEYRIFTNNGSRHEDERRQAILKIYQKHSYYWTLENLVKTQEAVLNYKEQLADKTALLGRLSEPGLKTIAILCGLWIARLLSKTLRYLQQPLSKRYLAKAQGHLRAFLTLFNLQSRR